MLFDLLSTIGAFAVFIATLTQSLKFQLGLKGRPVFFLSLGLGLVFGILFALGGLMEFKALRHFPDLLSGAVIGLGGGWSATGGKDLFTGIGRNNAKARAEFEAQYRESSRDAPPPLNDGWEDVDPREMLPR